jgi:hypothetical protein
MAYLWDESTNESEKRLLLAMLERAVLDFIGNEESEAKSAEEWIFSEESSDTPFTFKWLCQELDIDCVRVAQFISKLTKRGKNRLAPWFFTDPSLAMSSHGIH